MLKPVFELVWLIQATADCLGARQVWVGAFVGRSEVRAEVDPAVSVGARHAGLFGERIGPEMAALL